MPERVRHFARAGPFAIGLPGLLSERHARNYYICERMDDKLNKNILDEGGIMSDELFERFVGSMTEIRLKNKEVLIPYGKIDSSLYVQKDGLLRACYLDGENEKTYGFADAGTVTISYYSYFLNRPSVFKIESCGETTVLKMSKKTVSELIDSSHEFAKWLLSIEAGQLCANEFKHSAIIGTARERYLALIRNRPEIPERVSSKILASYLGVAPPYLSYLKKISLTGK
jgi:CRP-like cAMP-binding protein